MNQIPSINNFLNEIDPKNTIPREKAMAEITTIVLLSAINDSRDCLDEDCTKKLNRALNIERFSFEQVYKVYTEANKKEELFKSIDECLDKVKIDYIKTHLEAISMQKREEVIAKYPGLKDLVN